MSEGMDQRIILLERLKLQLSGYVYIGDRIKDGWKEPIPHYAFRCLKHGLIVDYPHGYDQRLECPMCRDEEKKTVKLVSE